MDRINGNSYNAINCMQILQHAGATVVSLKKIVGWLYFLLFALTYSPTGDCIVFKMKKPPYASVGGDVNSFFFLLEYYAYELQAPLCFKVIAV